MPWHERLEELLSEPVVAVNRLERGQESEVFRVATSARQVVVQLCAQWRTGPEVAWTHTVVEKAAATMPEAIAPIRCADKTLLEVEGKLAAVFPFIDGTPLDTRHEASRLHAAQVLARMHRALANWPGPARPAHGPDTPQHKRIDPGSDRLLAKHDPVPLRDARLDAWLDEVQERPLVTSAIQGDYWSANLLTANGRITGVIDWLDARIVPCISELASATRGICQGNLREQAPAFIAAYRDGGGPVADNEYELLVPFMRLRLRDLARRTLSMGVPPEHPYMSSFYDTFQALAHVTKLE